MSVNKLDHLRQEAIRALNSGAVSLDDADAIDHSDMVKLVENLRIYQAELELQHRELQKSIVEREETARRYNSLFYAIPVPVFTLTKVGLISECNLEAHTLFELQSAQDMRSHSIFRFQSVLEEARLYGFLNSAHLKKVVLDDFRMKTADGDRVFAVHLIRLSDEDEARDYAQMVIVPSDDQNLSAPMPHDLLRDLLNHSGQCYFVFGSDDSLLFSNEHQVWAEWVTDISDGLKRLVRDAILILAKEECKRDKMVAGHQLDLMFATRFRIDYRCFACQYDGKPARVFAVTALHHEGGRV